MAWDDLPDPCDSCVLFTGFAGTDEELKEQLKHIKCEGKKSCVGEIYDQEDA